MAYKTEELLKTALKAIEKHKLFFIEDVVAYLPCDRGTFYGRGLNKNDSIKELLDKNRIDVKVSMRNKWYKSDNATLQMGLMKLIGTEAEAHRLNGTVQKIEHSGGDGIKIIVKDFSEKDGK